MRKLTDTTHTMLNSTLNNTGKQSRQAGSPHTIEDVNILVADDMLAVNQLIEKRLQSEVALVNQVSGYIINSGGKRLRPVLVLLSARAFGYSGDQHFNLAAIVEFIHTATLLHDDVVDASNRRRGQETANALWGNEAAVLVGDFLYSRAFQMMVDAQRMRVMDILAHATNVIAEGEVLQLLNCNDPDTTEQRYLDVIHCKTAKLFEAAAQLGAVLCDASPEQEQALAKYGMHLGTAFQLVDDVLDYSASSEEMGKNVGDDLAEGKPTLPLILCRALLQGEHRKLVDDAIKQGEIAHLDQIVHLIRDSGALQASIEKAQVRAHAATSALEVIPDSRWKSAMLELAHYSVGRRN